MLFNRKQRLIRKFGNLVVELGNYRRMLDRCKADLNNVNQEIASKPNLSEKAKRDLVEVRELSVKMAQRLVERTQKKLKDVDMKLENMGVCRMI